MENTDLDHDYKMKTDEQLRIFFSIKNFLTMQGDKNFLYFITSHSLNNNFLIFGSYTQKVQIIYDFFYVRTYHTLSSIKLNCIKLTVSDIIDEKQPYL